MKRIGRYLITAMGLMTLGGTPALFAGDHDYRRDRREDRREFRRREERRERYDRDDWRYRYYYRRDWR
jgi:hypothetical protein